MAAAPHVPTLHCAAPERNAPHRTTTALGRPVACAVPSAAGIVQRAQSTQINTTEVLYHTPAAVTKVNGDMARSTVSAAFKGVRPFNRRAGTLGHSKLLSNNTAILIAIFNHAKQPFRHSSGMMRIAAKQPFREYIVWQRYASSRRNAETKQRRNQCARGGDLSILLKFDTNAFDSTALSCSVFNLILPYWLLRFYRIELVPIGLTEGIRSEGRNRRQGIRRNRRQGIRPGSLRLRPLRIRPCVCQSETSASLRRRQDQERRG